jgi:hypothetical protein
MVQNYKIIFTILYFCLCFLFVKLQNEFLSLLGGYHGDMRDKLRRLVYGFCFSSNITSLSASNKKETYMGLFFYVRMST